MRVCPSAEILLVGPSVLGPTVNNRSTVFELGAWERRTDGRTEGSQHRLDRGYNTIKHCDKTAKTKSTVAVCFSVLALLQLLHVPATTLR